MPENALSLPQIQSFKENGYFIVEDLVEEFVLEEWRQQLWTYLGAQPDDSNTWPRDQIHLEHCFFKGQKNRLSDLQIVREIVGQLGGGVFASMGGVPLIRWPRCRQRGEIAEIELDQQPHIDGYPPRSWWPFMLGATTYLYDVQPGGGGFVLWPRSHHKVWEYFRTHPQHIDGSFQDNDGQNLPWSFMLKKANVPPKEYCSRAGSVIFWHSFLIHAGSKNFRQWPRIAIFERWSHHRIHKIKYDIPDNLWKYWMIS